jgi:hypothetical protein
MIKVDCSEPCEYYFYSQIVDSVVTLLRPYTTYFDELANDEFYNYIFDERVVSDPVYGDNPVKNYTFKLETTEGNGSLYIKRCKQV